MKGIVLHFIDIYLKPVALWKKIETRNSTIKSLDPSEPAILAPDALPPSRLRRSRGLIVRFGSLTPVVRRNLTLGLEQSWAERSDRDWKVIGVCCKAAAVAIANSVDEEGKDRDRERGNLD
ncbi:unnamed protein product [Fraxinus pennsylvanica]|uniref:Uncharacterized protein n=1 Tax=Fraxinus pennsylvanica TaxID=56036 RepID=A0AAD1ZFB1_9LAMI|nr:unnamed protein product [Fraxinus pennsylvanica]